MFTHDVQQYSLFSLYKCYLCERNQTRLQSPSMGPIVSWATNSRMSQKGSSYLPLHIVLTRAALPQHQTALILRRYSTETFLQAPLLGLEGSQASLHAGCRRKTKVQWVQQGGAQKHKDLAELPLLQIWRIATLQNTGSRIFILKFGPTLSLPMLSYSC